MLKVMDKEPPQLAILSKEEGLKLERKELMEPLGILAILLVEKEMVTAKLVLTENLFLTFLEPWEKVANSLLIIVRQTEPLPFLIRLTKPET